MLQIQMSPNSFRASMLEIGSGTSESVIFYVPQGTMGLAIPIQTDRFGSSIIFGVVNTKYCLFPKQIGSRYRGAILAEKIITRSIYICCPSPEAQLSWAVIYSRQA